MRSIWVGIYPRPSETRVLAMAGPDEVLLKARLSSEAQHPRALATLLEALALWQGEPVRAALAVDERASGCGTSFCRDWFADAATPLYALDIVPVRRRVVGVMISTAWATSAICGASSSARSR
jgi:hypothetical protein